MSWDTSPTTGLFYVLLTSKGGNIAFLPQCNVQCCAHVLAIYRKQQTPQLWPKGTREGCGFFCSPKLPYLSSMSQQFCRLLSVFIWWLRSTSAVVTIATSNSGWTINVFTVIISFRLAQILSWLWLSKECMRSDNVKTSHNFQVFKVEWWYGRSISFPFRPKLKDV